MHLKSSLCGFNKRRLSNVEIREMNEDSSLCVAHMLSLLRENELTSYLHPPPPFATCFAYMLIVCLQIINTERRTGMCIAMVSRHAVGER